MTEEEKWKEITRLLQEAMKSAQICHDAWKALLEAEQKAKEFTGKCDLRS